MAPTAENEHPEGVVEHEGRLWRPKSGATSSAQEFFAAKSLFIDLHRKSIWNPWVLDDRAEELQRAEQVMEDWQRAEPDHRYMTEEEFAAREAERDREFEERRTADAKRHELDRERYDARREHARLSLLEHQSRLEYELREIMGFRDGTRFPAMDQGRRNKQEAELEGSIASLNAEIERLAAVVGDPEDVVDKWGWLPRDRRESMLVDYRIRRQSEVEELRRKIPELKAALKAATDQGERSRTRGNLGLENHRLEKLLAVPQLSVEDMCADCPQPFASHGWSTPPWDGPCPAWPGWAAQRKEAWKILESASQAKPAPTEPPKAKAKPLAVIPSGLPISEVIERLKELQEQYPDAEVRRGRANRWELWPAASTS